MRPEDQALLKEFFLAVRELANAAGDIWPESDHVERLLDRIDLKGFLPPDVTRAP